LPQNGLGRILGIMRTTRGCGPLVHIDAGAEPAALLTLSAASRQRAEKNPSVTVRPLLNAARDLHQIAGSQTMLPGTPGVATAGRMKALDPPVPLRHACGCGGKGAGVKSSGGGRISTTDAPADFCSTHAVGKQPLPVLHKGDGRRGLPVLGGGVRNMERQIDRNEQAARALPGTS